MATPPLTQDQAAQFAVFTTQNVADIIKSVTDSIHGLRADYQSTRQHESNANRIKEVASAIERCDGVHAVDVREWLQAMSLATDQTRTIPNNVHRLARKTTNGALYRHIEEWITTYTINGQQVTWAALRAFVTNRFLGQNELERLRLELAKMKQGSDNVLLFNRKFAEAAAVAYAEPREAETERLVMRYYATALTDQGLAKRIIIESGANSLQDAQSFADKMAAGEELYNSLIGHEPMDCSVVSEKVNHDKVIEQQNTKIAKLEAQIKQLTTQKRTAPPPQPQGQPQRQVKCFNCMKLGHYARDCRMPPRERGPSVHQPQGRPQHQGRRSLNY